MPEKRFGVNSCEVGVPELAASGTPFSAAMDNAITWPLDARYQAANEKRRRPEPDARRAEFDRLADSWERETGHLSNPYHREQHPAYRQIVALGPAAVPWLLERLAQRRDHWFMPLESITGMRPAPIPAPGQGTVGALTEGWLRWGREQGYVR